MFAAAFPSCFGHCFVRDANAPRRVVDAILPFIVFSKQSTVHLFIHSHSWRRAPSHTHTHMFLLFISVIYRKHAFNPSESQMHECFQQQRMTTRACVDLSSRSTAASHRGAPSFIPHPGLSVADGGFGSGDLAIAGKAALLQFVHE